MTLSAWIVEESLILELLEDNSLKPLPQNVNLTVRAILEHKVWSYVHTYLSNYKLQTLLNEEPYSGRFSLVPFNPSAPPRNLIEVVKDIDYRRNQILTLKQEIEGCVYVDPKKQKNIYKYYHRKPYANFWSCSTTTKGQIKDLLECNGELWCEFYGYHMPVSLWLLVTDLHKNHVYKFNTDRVRTYEFIFDNYLAVHIDFLRFCPTIPTICLV